MSYILGIDPGITGAYVILSKKKKYIKVCKLFGSFQEVLEDLKPFLGNIEACVEKVASSPQQGVKSVATFLENAGAWKGMLIALEIPFTMVPPQTWQRKVLDTQAPKTPLAGLEDKQIRKTAAANRKLRKMHIVSFVLRKMPKSKKYFNLVKDQDKADAMCIALFKRQEMGYVD